MAKWHRGSSPSSLDLWCDRRRLGLGIHLEGQEMGWDFEGRSRGEVPDTQWVDLRENLQEIIDFPMKYGIFL